MAASRLFRGILTASVLAGAPGGSALAQEQIPTIPGVKVAGSLWVQCPSDTDSLWVVGPFAGTWMFECRNAAFKVTARTPITTPTGKMPRQDDDSVVRTRNDPSSINGARYLILSK